MNDGFELTGELEVDYDQDDGWTTTVDGKNLNSLLETYTKPVREKWMYKDKSGYHTRYIVKKVQLIFRVLEN